jgi:hypothetical protein
MFRVAFLTVGANILTVVTAVFPLSSQEMLVAVLASNLCPTADCPFGEFHAAETLS